jgi:hypothetical protein
MEASGHIYTGPEFTQRTEKSQITLIRTNGVGVVMKSSVYWDITPCNPVKLNQRFTGTYRLHLQG